VIAFIHDKKEHKDEIEALKKVALFLASREELRIGKIL
jgi:hypothetical protein